MTGCLPAPIQIPLIPAAVCKLQVLSSALPLLTALWSLAGPSQVRGELLRERVQQLEAQEGGVCGANQTLGLCFPRDASKCETGRHALDLPVKVFIILGGDLTGLDGQLDKRL